MLYYLLDKSQTFQTKDLNLEPKIVAVRLVLNETGVKISWMRTKKTNILNNTIQSKSNAASWKIRLHYKKLKRVMYII